MCLFLLLNISVCETIFYFHRIKSYFEFHFKRTFSSDIDMKRSPFLIKKEILIKEKKLLRTLLQKTPLWLFGHLKLAAAELEQIMLEDSAPEPRALATIRVSAELIKDYCLINNFNPAHFLLLEANYFHGMYYFLNKNYRETLAIFKNLLLPENAAQLTKKMHDRILETAGRCTAG